MTETTNEAREPSGKPVLEGPARSNRDDAEWALTKARRYVFRGGKWSKTLHTYVDRWLEFLRQIPDGEKYPDSAAARSEAESHQKEQASSDAGGVS